MKQHSPSFYRNHIIGSGIVGAILIIIHLHILIVPLFFIWRHLVLAHTPKTMELQVIDRKHVNDDIESQALKRHQALAIINKQLLFPVLIIMYLTVLLIGQTNLRDLQLQTRYLALDQNFILFLVIISGLGTVYEPPLDKYIKTATSLTYHRLYVGTIGLLGLLATYIIQQQVVELGIIGHCVAIIVGILIFSVGITTLHLEEK